MGYSAGNLELSILGFSDKAVASVDVTTKALRRLASAVKLIGKTNFTQAGFQLNYLFKEIAKSTNQINTQNIEHLAAAAKSLASISRLSNLEKMDFEKVGKGFNTLSIAITPFLDKVKEAEASLTALDGVLRRSSGKKIQGLLDGGGKGNDKKKGGFGFLNIARWSAVLYASRRLGRTVMNIVQSGANYTETLNLWETSMGNNLNVATEFVNKMNEAYGISEKTLMNAQAIFKNMLGSLGQISDTMAYSISEGITQMALDYASLYNVTFENAFKKFQAALAGQVRPIRSVSGYDITENTIFQLYQSLGGEKTMRQLSRTEKQLLSILAVFKQMNASGAVGDLEKTMGSFANQSRVWAESLNDVKTWLGVIITYTIQESGIMIKLNAMLITVARYLEAVARNIGAIQSFGGSDPFAGTEQSAENAIDAIDELNGKLLDFDKFRSLSGGQENALGLDEKLLAALSGYDTILGNASLEARDLSDQWLRSLGYNIDENGELILTNEQLQKAKEKIDAIVNSLAEFDGLGTLKSIFPIVETFFTFLAKATPALTSIFTAMSPITIEILETAAGIVQLLDKLGLLEGVIKTIIAYKIGVKLFNVGKNIYGMGTALYSVMTTKLIPFITQMGKFYYELAVKAVSALLSYAKTILTAVGATNVMRIGIGLLIANVALLALGWDKMSDGEKVVGVFGAIGAAALAAAAAVAAFHQSWTMGTAAVAIIGGLAAIAGAFVSFKGTMKSMKDAEFFAGGASDIDGGTLFVAGEMGKTEAVYTGSNGKTNVANVRQMEQAFYNALSRHSREGNGTIVVQTYLDGEKVYENTTAKAKSRGNVWAKV
jgi:hypothetical protein